MCFPSFFFLLFFFFSFVENGRRGFVGGLDGWKGGKGGKKERGAVGFVPSFLTFPEHMVAMILTSIGLFFFVVVLGFWMMMDGWIDRTRGRWKGSKGKAFCVEGVSKNLCLPKYHCCDIRARFTHPLQPQRPSLLPLGPSPLDRAR